MCKFFCIGGAVWGKILICYIIFNDFVVSGWLDSGLDVGFSRIRRIVADFDFLCDRTPLGVCWVSLDMSLIAHLVVLGLVKSGITDCIKSF